MENFTNESIDTTLLPKFEEEKLTPLHPSYLKVVWLNLAIIFIVVALAAGTIFYFGEEVRPYWLPVAIAYFVLLSLSVLVSYINFRNRGFAFRTHDVIYRSGAIAITTAIIPYNRAQHVAMHEGWLSRRLGLAEVEIFTAGGDKSDIKIPGLEKEHAENIKQLLMGKILKQDNDDQ
ncbi:hypothetical protein HYN59_13215 [Flavobacterium album]|uniref:YdbS-like PH domain-containing protein n=1 Tax=Flavobacterium album TaxID=2175091 RepID=A0A2S1R0C6_9FLAO|nr:PH domain-containing protein [Flavobacterium album]AWH86009.1 hypothetical protein HYN59_13215 [Flavobacterium album]